MWTLSGSCPLYLTPPCYHLEPPATAAPFFVSIWITFCNLGGNYISILTIAPSLQRQPKRAMLTQTYTGCVSAPLSEAVCPKNHSAKRNRCHSVSGSQVRRHLPSCFVTVWRWSRKPQPI